MTTGRSASCRSGSETSPPPSRPRTKTPCFLKSLSVAVRLGAMANGIRAAAPALVFHAALSTLAERRCRPDDRAQVARVGDAVEGDEQRRLVAVYDLLEQILRMRVLVRPNLEGHALVHAVEAGHPVQFRPGDLHHGDIAMRRNR